jgi:hypothetical protein
MEATSSKASVTYHQSTRQSFKREIKNFVLSNSFYMIDEFFFNSDGT